LAAGRIESGMQIGLGTGTTAYWVIREIGDKIKNGFQLTVVPTSAATADLCQEMNIPLAELNDVERLELTIDGADEIDSEGNLIKGGGGALLQEKMVAAASEKLIIVAHAAKLVKKIGRFPLPVEVIPFGWKQVAATIKEYWGIEATLRTKNGEPFKTDHGHYILDIPFTEIARPDQLNISLHLIPGVVETGLFIGLTTELILADGNAELTINHFRRTARI